ncbi:MAG TPA: aminoacyl-tRNA hydrolase [Dongiaceae bacterium]|nr:aminoacyl-tRNA hydrolase [Dongiaceae bacterium]
MRLVVGLGNPGPSYAGNRHNIGFMAVDDLVRRHSFSGRRERFHGVTWEGAIKDEKIVLLCPLTYMNDSGRAVQAAAQFFKLQPNDVMVLHDELDLPLGRLKVKRGGGAGGHNGLRSIDAHLGNDYWRLRLGIGHPGVKELVKHYVLQDFAKAEWPLVKSVVETVGETFPLLIGKDGGWNDNGFMTKTSLILNPPPPKEAKLGEAKAQQPGDDTPAAPSAARNGDK